MTAKSIRSDNSVEPVEVDRVGIAISAGVCVAKVEKTKRLLGLPRWIFLSF